MCAYGSFSRWATDDAPAEWAKPANDAGKATPDSWLASLDFHQSLRTSYFTLTMVDEAAFRHAKGEINRLPCVFERALLARHAACELAVRHQIAERETVACAQPVARAVCAQMVALLRDKSAFALGLTGTRRVLPHAMVMKIQCGGLDGLKALLDADAVAPDVRRLVRLAKERYGDLAALPFSEIVQGVAAWQSRRRHNGESG